MIAHPRLRDGEVVVRAGTFPYESLRGTCWIVQIGTRPGTGAPDDEPDVRDDLPGTWFRIDHAPALDSLCIVSSTGYFATLEEALDHLREIAPDVAWDQG